MKKLFLFLLLLTFVISLNGCVKIHPSSNNNQKSYCENLLDITLPKQSVVIKSTDKHGGFHGDGTYYSVMKLNKKTLNDFTSKTLKSNKWHTLPLTSELHSLLFGYTFKSSDSICSYEGKAKSIPSNIKNGIYYFEDKYINNNPDAKNSSILHRNSYNFVFSLLDCDTGKLYTLEYDS